MCRGRPWKRKNKRPKHYLRDIWYLVSHASRHLFRRLYIKQADEMRGEDAKYLSIKHIKAQPDSN